MCQNKPQASTEGKLSDENKSHLESVAKSYDRGVICGRQGIDSYGDLPEEITTDPDYPAYLLREEGRTGSGHSRIREFLSPAAGMHFVDLGCCLNLMFRGYDEWPSTYHGVDISGETIGLLREFTAAKKLPVGSLYCGSIHETPYEDSTFDIGACIGVLEYFKRDFVTKAMAEAHRILKPGGRLAVDIPNTGSPACRIMMRIEAHLGRPDRFDLSLHEFEELICAFFDIDHTEAAEAGAMILYYLRCKK